MLEIVSLIVFIILIALPPLCAACLPHLMEKSQAMEIPEVSFCQHALTGGPLTGTVGSLAWEGDVIEMSRWENISTYTVNPNCWPVYMTDHNIADKCIECENVYEDNVISDIFFQYFVLTDLILLHGISGN